MATMSSPTTERRHLADRRAGRFGMSAKNLHALDWIAMTLLIIGGINWGLIGLFNFDLVGALFGRMSALSRIIYTLVGLSGLYSIYTSSKLINRR